MSTFSSQNIDAVTAQKAIAGAVEKAVQMGFNACITICDPSGDQKAFLRMDGAPKLAIDISQNKAYTSIGFGISTDGWWEFIKNDPPLLYGITHTPRLVVFGGGYPIKQNGEVIGAIGVSGGHYSQDMEVARAGLAAIGASAE